MARAFALAAGVGYAIIAVLELLFRTPFGGLLRFTPVHNGLHWGIAVVFLAAYAKGPRAAALASGAVGVVLLTLVALTLFDPARLSDLLGYPTNRLYDAVNLVTGAAGVIAAFVPARRVAMG